MYLILVYFNISAFGYVKVKIYFSHSQIFSAKSKVCESIIFFGCKFFFLSFYHYLRPMAEELQIATGTKEERYTLLCRQIASLVEGETDPIARMANVAAMIHLTFGFWWTGFYRVVGEELVLGPFQGPIACSRIARGRGVCGSAWQQQRTFIVPDVEQFPGHIACSSLSRSEIVVPMWQADEVIGVLDIDSEQLATFDEVDQHYLEEIVHLITEL